jgi:N-acetylglucosamine kinase-like BadF-type ATPase
MSPDRSTHRSPDRSPAVLAVDGGNSKTDAVVVDRAGRVLGVARWVGPSNVGRGDGAMRHLEEAVRSAAADARIRSGSVPIAQVGVYCLAGADFPIDERRIGRALERRGWTSRTVVRNDTFAVLRAGSERGWGVGVVCGAGMNCLGVAPDGRMVRFPALGPLSGDFAPGGEWVGLTALGSAIRARDGRGPKTALEQAVAQHFGMARPEAVMNAMYRGRIALDRLTELPPVVFDVAMSGDAVARAILDQVADEVVAMATAAIRRLRLVGEDVDVVLGGGMFHAQDPAFVGRIERGVHDVAPRARVAGLDAPPVLGAALIGLDEIDAGDGAASMMRASLDRETIGETRRRLVPSGRRSPGG